MKSTNDLIPGQHYSAKVRGHITVVLVKEIDKSGYKRHSTARIVCVDESNGQEVIFRSPSRLLTAAPCLMAELCVARRNPPRRPRPGAEKESGK